MPLNTALSFHVQGDNHLELCKLHIFISGNLTFWVISTVKVRHAIMLSCIKMDFAVIVHSGSKWVKHRHYAHKYCTPGLGLWLSSSVLAYYTWGPRFNPQEHKQKPKEYFITNYTIYVPNSGDFRKGNHYFFFNWLNREGHPSLVLWHLPVHARHWHDPWHRKKEK